MTSTPVYTESDQDTWRRFFAAAADVWARHAALIHPYYLQHTHLLQRFRDKIPSIAEVNQLLATVGWSAVYVDGLAPPWEIARSLAQQIMPISSSVRRPEEIYFASGPDLIHDIFGHLPLLMSGDYRQLLAAWSQAASQVPIHETDRASYHLNKVVVEAQTSVDDGALSHLKHAIGSVEDFLTEYPSPSFIFDKTYFWIFEFGLVRMQGELKIMGAGLLSSLREIEALATGMMPTRQLDFASVLSPYNISTLQAGYLVSKDMQHCRRLLADITLRVASSSH